ncbi:MAG UNVERIFIED_CONTAM: DUF1571 domain-containing protein [Planctomycetaceae bacterium]|jgi:hypothetical protein
MPRNSHVPAAGFHNTLAALLACTSAFVIFSCFDPVPAGEDLALVPGPAPVQGESSEADVPVPPEARHIPTQSSANSATKEIVPTISSEPLLTFNGDIGDEHRTFFLLMLQDGVRFLSNTREYSSVFHKQERLQGDLTEVQQIEMKVRHTPHFSVYMKWKNGDTGRQALYSDSYEDRKVSVKLGGIKGRILPAIRLNPTGGEAMAEARHPITEAGILFLAKRLMDDRRSELSRGVQVRCTRLPNTTVDERPCFQFQFEFPDAAASPEYRRSIVAIDSQYHIPLLVQNWTWTAASQEIPAAELDEQTLVESYSFSALNFGVSYADLDFSRENPKYRM